VVDKLHHAQDQARAALAARAPAVSVDFTPTGASWQNVVDRRFAELTNKKLKRSGHKSVADLNADIRGFIETWNEDRRPYVWTKSADQIRDSRARYCQRIKKSGR